MNELNNRVIPDYIHTNNAFINPTSERLLSYQLLYGGGIYHPPYKNLFKDQFDPIFCIGRGGGPKYHRKIFKK